MKALGNSFEADCRDYNGIALPSNKLKCCASTCNNLCGTNKCHEGLGGKEACCEFYIPERICGVEGRKAPCVLSKYLDFQILQD